MDISSDTDHQLTLGSVGRDENFAVVVTIGEKLWRLILCLGLIFAFILLMDIPQ